MISKKKRTIKVRLDGRIYSMVLKKEKGIRKDYLTLLLPKSLRAKVSDMCIEIIPVDRRVKK